MKKMMMISALLALMANWAFAQPPQVDKYRATRYLYNFEKNLRTGSSNFDLCGSEGTNKNGAELKDLPAKRILHNCKKNLLIGSDNDAAGRSTGPKNDGSAVKDQAATRFLHDYNKNLQTGGGDDALGRSVGPGYNGSAVEDQAAERIQHDCDKNLQTGGGNDALGRSVGPGYNGSAVEDQAADRMQHDCDKLMQVDGDPPPDNVGIIENRSTKNVNIVNPVENSLIIRSADDVNILRILVYDSRGTLVISEAVNSGYAQIPADRLKTGMYFVKIYLQEGIISKQIYKV